MRLRKTTFGWAVGPAIGLLAAAMCVFVWAQEEAAETEDAPAAEEIRIRPKRLSDYDLPGLNARAPDIGSLEPTDVVDIISFLAQSGGLGSIVIGKNVQATTTKLRLSNATIADAMEVLLSVNRLAYEVNNGIITIMTDQDYKDLHGISFYDQKDVEVVELKYAKADRIKAILAEIKSEMGIIVSDAGTGTLILIDTPEKIREMRAIISKADTQTETRSFFLQYSAIDEIKAEVTALLTPQIGSMRADSRTKTLIVTDLADNMKKIEELISLFDRRSKQVFIEAKIVEIALDDEQSLGINWQHVFEGLDPRFSLQTVSQPGAAASPVGYMNFSTIVGGGDLTAVLSALKSVGETRILSNPQIAVVDGQEAKIQVIEDQPYKEVAYESGTTNVTGVTYIFKEVGVTLAVTPRINDDRFISVDIRPEISSISSWYDGGPQEGTPVIKKAFAETTVMVKDGVTIIIGGLIKDRHDKSASKVPLVGSIPLLGRLFRYDSVTVVNTETVVFMTPRIISGEEPFLRLKDMKKQPKPLRPAGTRDVKTFKPVR